VVFVYIYVLSVSIVVSSFIFFFYFHGAHRDLHSFPTRRSSDLNRPVLLIEDHDPVVVEALGHEGADFQVEPAQIDRAAALPGSRSEEHTSELQSQSNLVCRLLLEKKKTKKTDLPNHTLRYIHTH